MWQQSLKFKIGSKVQNFQSLKWAPKFSKMKNDWSGPLKLIKNEGSIGYFMLYFVFSDGPLQNLIAAAEQSKELQLFQYLLACYSRLRNFESNNANDQLKRIGEECWLQLLRNIVLCLQGYWTGAKRFIFFRNKSNGPIDQLINF